MSPALETAPGLRADNTGPIHFIGIGGIGMSGIAEVLHTLGFRVQGSDRADSANVKRLRGLGVPVVIGHSVENLGDAEVVVISTAVPRDNPELVEARRRFVPVVHRAAMLSELMRLRHAVAIAGTHGKTTTTSLVSQVLYASGLDPTTINGGIVNAWGSNARLGSGQWMVVEADESDGSFERIPATVAVVTGCDPEHMEFWGSEERLQQAFVDFVHRVPFYGFAVLCLDHPTVRAIAHKTTDRRVITYGLSPQAEVRAEAVEVHALGTRFDLILSPRDAGAGAGAGASVERRFERVHLSLFGRHNVQNALAAIAVAEGMNLSTEKTLAALGDFSGVKRRFTRTGEIDGAVVVDDYGHHPVEIRATLETARALARGRVFAVVQPHRYSRLAALFAEFCACFDDAVRVFVSPVYAAGELPIAEVNAERLVEGLLHHGHRGAEAVPDLETLVARLESELRAGDFVVCLGAGDITHWATELPNLLRRARDRKTEGAA